MQEKEIEKRFCEQVKNIGGLCLKWISPGTRGVPDRIVLLPGGRIYFVELKRPGGSVSKIQSVVHNKFRRLGIPVYIVASDKDGLELIRRWTNGNIEIT